MRGRHRTDNKYHFQALARVGAALVVLSLLTPWYVLQSPVGSGLGKSGLAALGGLALALTGLAVAAGSSAIARLHPRLPAAAAAVLAVVVADRLVSPPAATSAFGQLQSGGSLNARLAESFASHLSSGFGLHYAPSWGLWLASFGAAASLVGALSLPALKANA